MNEITLLQSLVTQQEAPDTEARAAAWRELETKFALAGPAQTPTRHRSPRRRLLVLSGAGALMALTAVVLLLSSGPSAEPAAAEVLRQTAAIAAAPDGISLQVPGPGQFLYTKKVSSELEGWIPGETTVGGGPITETGAFNALVTTQEEEWTSAGGAERRRLVLDAPHLLTTEEQDRWEHAGAPYPVPFEDVDKNDFPGSRVLQLSRGVMDIEEPEGSGFVDVSALPTEPKALRRAVEERQFSGPTETESIQRPSTRRVIAELWDILDEQAFLTPGLRAAVFGALAELPGIQLNRDATDMVGRHGYSLSYETQKTGGNYVQAGIRTEYVFDPNTSRILGKNEVIVDPAAVEGIGLVAPDSIRRASAYLESAVVESARKRPGREGAESLAKASSTGRRS